MNNNQKGLTLLEVMIALLIFTIMSSAIFGAFIAAGRMDMSSKSFTEARGLGQSQLERIYNNSQTLSYADSLYQLETIDGFECTGFSWSTDLVSGSVVYSEPENTVVCTKEDAKFLQVITHTKDSSLSTINMIQIRIEVFSIDPDVKRYETLYATEFK
jgi:prepilin-type N-terminal cleavage/methylation domain-containing protein